jgi:hypothetical protein
MTTAQAFHRGTAPIFAILTPDQMMRLAELQGDPGLVSRLAELDERANEGELSPADREEYEAYVDANNLLAVLQAEARIRLSHSESPDERI